MVNYNPLNKFYKSITGPISNDEQVTFRVKGNFDSVVFVLKKDGCAENYYPMLKQGDTFELSIKLQVGLYFYTFKINNCSFLGKGDNLDSIITNEAEFYQLSVFDKNFSTPDFIKGGVIYQIFPDRFCKVDINARIPDYKVLHKDWKDLPVYEPNEYGKVLNNDFFGGNLKGIQSKLDYLKSLGVSVIYLNPIFKAYSNHRYDTGDYMQIDPLLGSEQDLIDLINSAKEKGIAIVLDGVFNHTGDDSIYFNKYDRYDGVGAYQSKNSPYYKWFNFTEYPTSYESWWGIATLPSVNEKEQSYIDFITGKDGVLEHYTKLGIKGWRLDVVDELPDSFVKNINKAVKGIDSEAIVIGEVWEDASNKITYGERREYFLGGELDSVMNYPLKNAILHFAKFGDVKQLKDVILEQIDHYPNCVLNCLMNILATHDTYRLMSSLSMVDTLGMTKKQLSLLKLTGEDYKNAIKKVKVASILQYTLYGVPSVYYGDEIGMQGYTDPLNRCCMDWENGDKELLKWFTLLGKIRNEYDCFSGDFELVYAKGGVVCYTRTGMRSQAFICINNSNKEITLNFDGGLKDLLTNEKVYELAVIKPFSQKVLVAI